MLTPVKTARALRQQMTESEKMLWKELRAHRFKGYKFRRQHPLPYQVLPNKNSFYVADFYCGQKKLIVELDGKHHQFGNQLEYDIARDKLLSEFGMKILRIQNSELKNIDAVLDKIEEALSSSPPPDPSGPLHKWRGGT